MAGPVTDPRAHRLRERVEEADGLESYAAVIARSFCGSTRIRRPSSCLISRSAAERGDARTYRRRVSSASSKVRNSKSWFPEARSNRAKSASDAIFTLNHAGEQELRLGKTKPAGGRASLVEADSRPRAAETCCHCRRAQVGRRAPDSNRNRLSSVEQVSTAHPALGFRPSATDRGYGAIECTDSVQRRIGAQSSQARDRSGL